jgi:DNA-binding PucR family transcriptional regulator
MPSSQLSPRILDLFGRGAQIALNAPAQWLDELDRATLSAPHMQPIAEDPVLRESTRRANRSNLEHWAAANVRAPGAPVSPNLGPEMLDSTRNLVRRGLSEAGVYAFRAGQNTTWLRWMEIVFSLTADVGDIRELLDASSRSISQFIDATIEAVSAQIQLERHELTSGTHAERRELIALLMDGAPVPRERAESRLGYRLDQAHTAAVIWSTEPNPDPGALEAAAEALMRGLGARQRLTVIASAGAVWMWTAAPGTAKPQAHALAAIPADPGIRVAVGTQRPGLDGFRRSHLEAVACQRMLARLGSPQRLATFSEVQLVALATTDPDQAEEFVQRTLGDLSGADPEIRATVRTFLHKQSNIVATASALHAHRNTVLRRLTRAEQLLPRPLADSAVQVAVALDILYWRG